MYKHFNTSFLFTTGIITLLFSTECIFAQDITNPDSLSKNPFAWNQQEKEFGFFHMDRIFKVRDVPKGNKVHELKQVSWEINPEN